MTAPDLPTPARSPAPLINAKATIVACLGSSSTAGKGQAFDWISELAQSPRNKSISFLNFGVGGDLAYNALQRLPKMLACHPHKVLVLIGGNDVIALVSSRARRFFRISKHLPKEPSPEWFRENLTAIARELKTGSTASIGLCSLPPIGEDPASTHPFQSEINEHIAEYSAIIREVAGEEAVAYIPVHETMLAQILASPGRAFTAFRFLPFYRDAIRVLVLHRTPDQVAELNRWRFHTDGVHLNSRGGMIVAKLVQEFIDR